MNLELLESFGQNYPGENDGTLDCITMAITCQFNRYGTLLAVGCNDGRIVVWDFLTRGIAKIIQAHVHPVCSLSWSRSGRKVVSASTDNTVTLWDVLSGECDLKFRFPSPVLKVQFHPRNEKEILVSPMRHAAVVVTLTDSQPPQSEEGSAEKQSESSPESSSESKLGCTHKLVPLEDENDTNIVATYDPRGKYIYTGNSRGRIMVVLNETASSNNAGNKKDDKSFKTVTSFKVTQASSSTNAVKSIEFARRSKSFLVNTADRVIRVYKTADVLKHKEGGGKDPEPDQKLQDLVNKTMWKKCCFSGDGEYVCAGSARQHALYIWEKSGNLVKILHGTKGEILLDVVWHPVRPIVASISQGVVTVWAQQQVENWSAFAPDFKELDENVDYEERESEFDVEDEDRSDAGLDNDGEKQDQAIEVDVTKEAPIAAFCSSDEEEEDKGAVLYLPIAPEIEDPEENFVPGIDSLSPTPGDGENDGGGSGSGNKRSAESKENANPSKRPSSKKPKTVEISLENAPTDEVHPFLTKSGGGGGGGGGSKDKGGPGKRLSGRPGRKDKAGKNK